MAGFEIFINPTISTESELELFKEIAIDFETGEPIIKDGEIVVLEGKEALKVWIWKVLKTERNRYEIYSENYGNDLKENIGQIYDETTRRAIIQNEIIECLMVNPHITSVNDFTVELDEERRHPVFYFTVSTIYGELNNEEVGIIAI